MSYEMEKEAEVMCNLSDGVEKRGFNRGLSQGIDSDILTGYISNMRLFLSKSQ